MPVYSWSQTASNNTNSDSTVNWQEGQLAPTCNNSFRAMMAAIASWVADISGNLQTTGSGGVFAVTTNSGFTNLSQLAGQMLAVKFNQAVSNSGATLNVDGLGAIRISYKGSFSVTLLTGAGTVYILTYDGTQNFFNITASA